MLSFRPTRLGWMPTTCIYLCVGFLVLGSLPACDLFEKSNPSTSLRLGDLNWKKTLVYDEVDNTQPLLVEGVAYVAADHHLSAYDVETGDRLWQSTPLRSRGRIFGKTVLHDDGTLFLNDVNVIRGFDASTGTVLWKTVIPEYRTLGGNTMGESGDYLYVGGDRELVEISKIDGAITRRFPFGTDLRPSTNHEVEDPVYSSDGIIYLPVAMYRDDAPTTEGRVHAFDPETEEIIWTYETPTTYQESQSMAERASTSSTADSLRSSGAVYGLAVSADYVVAPSGQLLTALDRRTGEVVWQRTYTDTGFDYGATISEGVVYVGSVGERVYAVELDTGRQLWDAYSPGSITTILTVKDDYVYLCNEAGGQIWVFDKRTGETVWNSFPPGHRQNDYLTYLSPLGVGEKYMVNVGSREIYALKRTND